jgi:endonuclease/exonuclease/phosphatase family metal-dependent hydrolase
MIKSILFSLLLSGSVAAQYSAMTYNIRYSTPNDGENWWEHRKEWVADLTRFYEPDVMGIQEGLHHQVMFLDSALTDYSFVGVGRDDGKTQGEYAAIFYQHDDLEVLDSGTFWLSETPEEPSYGWGANFRRISTWAKFRRVSNGKEFFVFNAHFDHEVALSRLNSAKLIHMRSKELNDEGLPVIVMGDFNAVPDAPPIQFMTSVLNDSKVVSETPPYGPEGTFNGFDTSHPLDRRIDYIFADDQVTVHKYGVLSDTQNQRTPSDHLPVFIRFDLK